MTFALAAVGLMSGLLASSASGSSTSSAVADVSVVQQLRHGVLLAGQPPQQPFDPASGLVIYDSVTVIDTVQNTGPDATAVTFQESVPSASKGEWPQAILTSTYTDSAQPHCGGVGWPQTPGLLTIGCTFTLGSGHSTQIIDTYEAEAPGDFSVTTSATTPDIDPDPTNDMARFTTNSRCSIVGTPGNDVLVGTSDTDSLCGEGGNDTLIAAGYGESLFGQGGNDTIDLGAAQWARTVVGGDGTDTVSFAGLPNPIMVCQGSSDQMGSGGMGPPGWGEANIFSVEGVLGSSYPDWLQGGPENSTISGGPGADIIRGGGGHDVINGGRGQDRIYAADHLTDHINGGLGTDHTFADPRDRVTSARRAATLPRWDPCDG
ncbi:MAG: hypothetical protein ACRDQZ_12320 [Mycobacteriales bacterium]